MPPNRYTKLSILIGSIVAWNEFDIQALPKTEKKRVIEGSQDFTTG